MPIGFRDAFVFINVETSSIVTKLVNTILFLIDFPSFDFPSDLQHIRARGNIAEYRSFSQQSRRFQRIHDLFRNECTRDFLEYLCRMYHADFVFSRSSMLPDLSLFDWKTMLICYVVKTIVMKQDDYNRQLTSIIERELRFMKLIVQINLTVKLLYLLIIWICYKLIGIN